MVKRFLGPGFVELTLGQASGKQEDHFVYLSAKRALEKVIMDAEAAIVEIDTYLADKAKPEQEA